MECDIDRCQPEALDRRCGFNSVTMADSKHYCPRCGWRPTDDAERIVAEAYRYESDLRRMAKDDRQALMMGDTEREQQIRKEVEEAFRCLTLIGHAGRRWGQKAFAAIPHLENALQLLGDDPES